MPDIILDEPPTLDDPRLVSEWVIRQFGNIQRALNEGIDNIQLTVQYVEPVRPRQGMVVLASGTVEDAGHWDPAGDGTRGFFGFYSGNWIKLG